MLKRTVKKLLLRLFIQIGVNVIGLPDVRSLSFYRFDKERNIKQRYSY